ncbi:MAG: response regulator transcription factor [Limisphaerales bacterium]
MLAEVTPAAPGAELTPREGEIAQWIARGKTNPEIGMILALSPRTVEKHVEHILSKFGVENRVGVVVAMTCRLPIFLNTQYSIEH